MGSGDIYKRLYTWKADQVARVDTCLLDGGTPRTEAYTYDQMLRLTAADGGTSLDGPFASRTYGYDSRSNRTAVGGVDEDGVAYTLAYSGPPWVDRLASISSGKDSQWVVQYTYDVDGRTTSKSWGLFMSGAAANTLSFTYGPSVPE